MKEHVQEIMKNITMDQKITKCKLEDITTIIGIIETTEHNYQPEEKEKGYKKPKRTERRKPRNDKKDFKRKENPK
ncbi:2071_t:CDS:2 [Cetraspora pellucida]|uniref:2071_t:CDS:1 n=1 Tax=Cetraspora pellucida TaxID=1433469 RepID=A0A9N8ZIL3_9GLOM|nr:2071_t:CDS:2 [Cetraspora pellucida]